MSEIQPLADRVLVRPVEEPSQTPGGIYVPEVAKGRPQRAEVVAVGPGRYADDGHRIAPSVQPGDTVIFGKFSGAEVSLGDGEHLILREQDLLAVLG